MCTTRSSSPLGKGDGDHVRAVQSLVQHHPNGAETVVGLGHGGELLPLVQDLVALDPLRQVDGHRMFVVPWTYWEPNHVGVTRKEA